MILVEIVLNLLGFWLLINVGHYWFSGKEVGNSFFCLSNKWKQNNNQKNGDNK